MIKEILNKIISNILYVAIIAAVVFGFIFYRSYKNTKAELKEQKQANNELVTKYDSVLALPPDTIVKPAHFSKGEYVNYFKHYKDSLLRSIVDSLSKARYDSIESTYTSYRDSIVNDSVHIVWDIKAKDVFSIDANYKPIYKYQEKQINTNIPYPVETIKEVKVNQRGLFVNAGLGYGNNDNSLSTVDNIAFKAGFMYLTRKSNTFNLDYVRYDQNNIFAISYGIKM
jgi:hypothetical protein